MNGSAGAKLAVLKPVFPMPKTAKTVFHEAGKLAVLRVCLPTFVEFWRPSIEYTGLGTQLCYEGYGGRWFRSSEKKVREAVDMFCMDLANGNYINFNDLYANLGIEQTHFGAQWGYSPDVECGWGYSSITFEVTLLTEGELVEKMGESILLIEPRYDCYPIENYYEV